MAQIEDNDQHFQTKLKAAGVLDIVETYIWDGRPTQHKRRDKRSGMHTGVVVRTAEGPSIQCALCPWLFVLSSSLEHVLHIHSMALCWSAANLC